MRHLYFVLLILSFSIHGAIIGGENATESSEIDGIFEFAVPSYQDPNQHSFCTATKIAEDTFITAAHCFNLNRSPSRLKFSTAIKNIFYENYINVEVERLLIHDSYLKSKYKLRDIDIAIVVIKSHPLFSKLPSRLIDFKHVKAKTPVVYFGFGCEESNNKSSDSFPIKKQAENTTLPPSTLKKNFGVFTNYVNYYSREIYRKSLLTSGLSLAPTRSSLCSGDSGGPVFVNGKLVAINTTFLDNFDDNISTRKGLSSVNVHDRLSVIQGWIIKNLNSHPKKDK